MPPDVELRLRQAELGLKAESWQDRLVAMSGLLALPESAMDKLLEMIVSVAKADSDAECRCTARGILASLNRDLADKAVSYLAEGLRDESRHLRGQSVVTEAEAMGELGPAAGLHSEELAALMKDTSSYVRRAAACALGRLLTAEPDPTEPLVEALKDRESEVRRGAVRGLGALGTVAAPHAEHLAKMLQKDTSYLVRRDCASALAAVGGKAAEQQASALSEAAIRDSDPEVRQAASKALAAVQPGTGMRLLIEALGDVEVDIRLHAAEALVAHGQSCGQAGESLQPLLTDDYAEVRLACVSALTVMEDHVIANNVSDIVDCLLRESDSDVQHALSLAIRAMGDYAVNQGNYLAEAAGQSGDARVRLGAALGLWALGTLAAANSACLVKRLADDSWFVRRAAAKALGAMGECSAQYTEQLLLEAARDLDDDVRMAALEALTAQGHVGDKHLNLVVKMTEDPKPTVQIAALLAIGACGKCAESHLHVLREQLRSKDPSVRHAVLDAYSLLPPSVPGRDDVQCIENIMRLDVRSDVQEAAKGVLGKWNKL